jgi:cell division protein FtsB
MTARRGSFRFKVKRLASDRLGSNSASSAWQRQLSRWTRFASAIVVGAAALLLAGAFGVQTYRVAAQNYRLHKQIVSAERRNDALAADSVRLHREIVLLHDPDYLVPLIHEQLGLVKPHEVFIVISPTPAPGK